jgi:hypothetical protein
MYSVALSAGSFTVPGPLRTKKSPPGLASIPFHFIAPWLPFVLTGTSTPGLRSSAIFSLEAVEAHVVGELAAKVALLLLGHLLSVARRLRNCSFTAAP